MLSQANHSPSRAVSASKGNLQTRGLLETITQTLMGEEVLEGEALKAILAQAVAPDSMGDWLLNG